MALVWWYIVHQRKKKKGDKWTVDADSRQGMSAYGGVPQSEFGGPPSQGELFLPYGGGSVSGSRSSPGEAQDVSDRSGASTPGPVFADPVSPSLQSVQVKALIRPPESHYGRKRIKLPANLDRSGEEGALVRRQRWPTPTSSVSGRDQGDCVQSHIENNEEPRLAIDTHRLDLVGSLVLRAMLRRPAPQPKSILSRLDVRLDDRLEFSKKAIDFAFGEIPTRVEFQSGVRRWFGRGWGGWRQARRGVRAQSDVVGTSEADRRGVRRVFEASIASDWAAFALGCVRCEPRGLRPLTGAVRARGCAGREEPHRYVEKCTLVPSCVRVAPALAAVRRARARARGGAGPTGTAGRAWAAIQVRHVERERDRPWSTGSTAKQNSLRPEESARAEENDREPQVDECDARLAEENDEASVVPGYALIQLYFLMSLEKIGERTRATSCRKDVKSTRSRAPRQVRSCRTIGAGGRAPGGLRPAKSGSACAKIRLGRLGTWVLSKT